MTITAQLHDGRTLEFPDGTDPSVVQRTVKQMLGQSAPAAPAADWEGSSNQDGNTPRHPALQTLMNVPGSALRFGKSIADAVMSPVQTVKGVADAAAGGLRNITPAPIREAIDAIDPNPQAAARATATADAVGQMYKDRYGSMRAAKQTAIDDPVGVAADLSTVLGVGGAVLPGRVGAAVSRASTLTNPLTPVIAGTGAVLKHGLGFATQTGPASVEAAFRAGKAADKAFPDNMRGAVPMSDVIDAAKQGVANMGAQKSAQYRAGMAGVAKDKTVLGFDGIDKALTSAAEQVTYRGVSGRQAPQVKSQSAALAVAKMSDEVSAWRKLDPREFHTPEGFDALKQKLGDILEGIPFEEKAARLAAGKVYAAAKESIQAQAPTYAKTMKDYAQASDQIKEIERALSLGGRAAQDTALRKLQSIMRNNANTNYGNRLDLAGALEKQGGVSLMPSLAGQAMNTWTPRGLAGQLGAGAVTYGAIASNPWLAGLLAPQSPRLVGELAYGAGRAAGASPVGLGPVANAARAGGLLQQALSERPEDW